MSNAALRALPEVRNEFDVTLYSDEECRYLLRHLGETASVATQKEPVPLGCSEPQLRLALQRFWELEEGAKAANSPWCGYDVIDERIKQWLEYREIWDTAKAEDPSIQHPSMFGYDSEGNPYYQSTGSDSKRVITFMKDGERVPWAVTLRKATGPRALSWQDQWKEHASEKLTIVVDSKKERIECPVCNHTESFKKGQRSTYNLARARMKKHCISADNEVPAHRKVAKDNFEA